MPVISNIVITPNPLKLGTFHTTLSKSLTITNNNAFSITLASVNLVFLDRFFLTSSLPVTISAFGNTAVTFLIDPGGNPILGTSFFQLNFTGYDPVLVQVFGNRFSFIEVPHNWVSPIRETYSWLTDILKSRNGTEQRIELRAFPRRTIEIDHQTRNNPERIRLNSTLYSVAHQSYGVPLWQDKLNTISLFTAGGSGLQLNGPDNNGITGYDFYTGGSLIFFIPSGGLPYQIYTIIAASGFNVFIDGTLATNVPAGTKVYPLKVVYGSESTNISRQTSHHQSFKVAWESFHESTTQSRRFLASFSPPFYKGLPVLDRHSDYSSPVSISGNRETFIQDYNVGTVRRRVYDLAPQFAEPFTELCPNRVVSEQMFGWMAYCRGMLQPFYRLCRGDEDLTVAQLAGVGLTQVIVKTNDFIRYLAPGGVPLPARRHFGHINSFTGAVTYHTITSAAYIGDDALLTLQAPISTAMQLGDKLSNLKPVRLGSDSVSIEWHTSTVATFSFVIQDLQYDPGSV